MFKNKLIIYTDGGARGNPGPAGIGGVIYNQNKKIIAEVSQYLGESTNNQAEYKALIITLQKVLKLGASEVDCYLDSELVVKQLRHEYKVKNKDLAPLFLQVYNLSLNFQKISFNHVPREQNKKADQLANQAMDQGTKY